MRKSQELAIELSECREKLNRDPEAADAGELRKRSLALEADWRTEIRREDEADAKAKAEAEAEAANGANGDGEAAEVRALVESVECRVYLHNAATGGILAGRERELNDHFGIGQNAIPWEALAPPAEHRADATTTAPATSSVMQNPILSRVFARSDAAYLGVAQPMVATGRQNFPVFSTGASGEQLDESASGSDIPAASFVANVVNPKRLQARYRFSIESAAVFEGMESALRADLSNALAEAADKRLVNDELLGATGLTNPTDPSAVATWLTGFNELVEQVDGRYCNGVNELRLLVGAGTYQLFETLFAGKAGTDATEMSLGEKLMSRLGGYRVSAHVPAASSNIQAAIVALGMNTAAVTPWWQGPQIIVDRVTRAGEGEVVLTIVALRGFALLRQDAMKRLEFKLA